MEGDELLDDVFGKAFDLEVAPAAELPEPEVPEPGVPPVIAEVVVPPVVAEVVVPPVVVAPVAPTAAEIAAAVKASLVVEPPAAAAVLEVEDPKVLEALADFKEQWPTQEIAVNSILSKALKAQEVALTTKFEAALAGIEAKLAPLSENVQSTAAEKHMAAITTAHADALTILPAVEAWIATQPEYLQGAYNGVLDNGSSAQIVKFLTDYKKATGAPAPAAPVVPKVDESRLRRMETPTTVRTSVSGEDDPTDFDSGFEAEVKRLKLAS